MMLMIFITGKIVSKEYQCLIYTGSEVNLIPEGMARGMIIETTPQKLVAANGSEIELIGQVKVDVEFSWNGRQQVTFLVSKEIEEIVLVMEFLADNIVGWTL